MLEYGSKIAKLRKDNNMTQAELGKALNVSYQAVSKWERNTSQPDFEIIQKMAKLFKISLDTFADSEEVKNDLPVKQDEKLICQICLKELSEEQVYCKEPKVICQDCQKRAEQESADIQSAKTISSKNKFTIKRGSFKKRLMWSVIGAVIFFILGLVSWLIMKDESPVDTTGYFVTTFVVALLIFTFIFQLDGDSLISDIVSGSIGHTISMPGVIFSLDLNSILLTILYKVIIAPLITFCIAAVIFLGGLLLAIIISPFTFPFSLSNAIKSKGAD